jgi:hypothetical protein
MIIALSGRAGSGKDTVGNIMQYLTLPGERGEYIGFQTYNNTTLERNSPFKIKKFAGKLKTIASLLTGVPVERFEDQEFKKQCMELEWGMTYREFLQKLGTEAMRNGLHENAWCNALFSDYKSKRETLGGDGKWIETDKDFVHFGERFIYPNWIITDMRFPNEMEAVVKRKGITIRVQRFEQISENIRVHGTGVPHSSETALDDAEFDYTIENNGTLDELVEKVRAILILENIIT